MTPDVSDDLGAARARGDSARRFVEAEATVSAVADRYEEIVWEILRLKKPKHTSGGDRSSPAVNAIGYWAGCDGSWRSCPPRGLWRSTNRASP